MRFFIGPVSCLLSLLLLLSHVQAQSQFTQDFRAQNQFTPVRFSGSNRPRTQLIQPQPQRLQQQQQQGGFRPIQQQQQTFQPAPQQQFQPTPQRFSPPPPQQIQSITQQSSFRQPQQFQSVSQQPFRQPAPQQFQQPQQPQPFQQSFQQPAPQQPQPFQQPFQQQAPQQPQPFQQPFQQPAPQQPQPFQQPSPNQVIPIRQLQQQPPPPTVENNQIFPGLTGQPPRDVITQNAALNGANVAFVTQNGGEDPNGKFLSEIESKQPSNRLPGSFPTSRIPPRPVFRNDFFTFPDTRRIRYVPELKEQRDIADRQEETLLQGSSARFLNRRPGSPEFQATIIASEFPPAQPPQLLEGFRSLPPSQFQTNQQLQVAAPVVAFPTAQPAFPATSFASQPPPSFPVEPFPQFSGESFPASEAYGFGTFAGQPQEPFNFEYNVNNRG